MKPNVIAIASDAAQFPMAAFLVKKLTAMNRRSDTDILLISDSQKELQTATQWGLGNCNYGWVGSGIQFKGGGHISPATYFRLSLPRLSGAKRLLYLDVDTFPDGTDLFDLFDVDMGGHVIAAARDLDATCLGTPTQRAELERTNRQHDLHYFNAGVLLIDVDRFNRQDIERRCIVAIANNEMHDQAALNLVLDGDWLDLSPSFNMTPLGYVCGVSNVFQPVISHFMGRAKPWHGALFYLDHRARKEIEAFIPASPWPRFLDGNPTPEMVKINRWEPPPEVLAAIDRYLRGTTFAPVGPPARMPRRPAAPH